MSRPVQLDATFMAMTKEFAKLSHSKRLQVGAMIVRDGNILSCGFNGTISGFNNTCEDLDNKTIHSHVLHAEANAITKLTRSALSSDGSTIYVTDSPCIDCSKLLIQAGIKRLVFERDYRDHSGIDLLLTAGIQVDRIYANALESNVGYMIENYNITKHSFFLSPGIAHAYTPEIHELLNKLPETISFRFNLKVDNSYTTDKDSVSNTVIYRNYVMDKRSGKLMFKAFSDYLSDQKSSFLNPSITNKEDSRILEITVLIANKNYEYAKNL